MVDQGISICIPAYNGGLFLREALDSAVAQTYGNMEVLIVDDNSTDNTLAIAQEYAARYPFVRVVENKSGEGMVANWMKCLELARYRWIKYLFQDDTLEDNCLEVMMNLAQQTGKKIVLGARRFLLDSSTPETYKHYFRIITKPEQLFSRHLISPEEIAGAVMRYGSENILGEPVCLLFDKTIVAEIDGFDRRLHQLVDYDFIVRAGLTYGLAFVREPLINFRVHDKSQSSANAPQGKNTDAIVRRARTEFGDPLLLTHFFLYDHRYAVMKAVWQEKDLLLFIRYLYLKACKRFGAKKVRAALDGIWPLLPRVHGTRYHYLKYKWVKFQYKQFLRKCAKP